MPVVLQNQPCCCQHFKLTPTETRVAALLKAGKSTREIRQILNIAASTLKTHLGNIFEKTGTSHQVELVRLLCLGPRPQEP